MDNLELTEENWKEICKDCFCEELWRTKGQYANTPVYLRRFILYNAYYKFALLLEKNKQEEITFLKSLIGTPTIRVGLSSETRIKERIKRLNGDGIPPKTKVLGILPNELCKCGHIMEHHYHTKKRFGFLWRVPDLKNKKCVSPFCSCQKFLKEIGIPPNNKLLGILPNEL